MLVSEDTDEFLKKNHQILFQSYFVGGLVLIFTGLLKFYDQNRLSLAKQRHLKKTPCSLCVWWICFDIVFLVSIKLIGVNLLSSDPKILCKFKFLLTFQAILHFFPFEAL
jgi:hypothetical protein